MNCTDIHRRLDWRKFFSSSTTSAATARGFRDDNCDHTHPGFDNTFAALDTTAAQGTFIKHTHKPRDAKDHPAIAACALSKAQHRGPSCCSLHCREVTQENNSAQKPQPPPKQKAGRLHSCFQMAIFALEGFKCKR